jgi:hypothetical protein
MVTLTELSLDSDLGEAPTILSLFRTSASAGAPPEGLSAWDQALLDGLYRTSAANRGQRSSLSQRVVESVATKAEAGPPG